MGAYHVVVEQDLATVGLDGLRRLVNMTFGLQTDRQTDVTDRQVRTRSFNRAVLRVRFHIIRNDRIENVGKSQSCMVSKLRMIRKQTVYDDTYDGMRVEPCGS